MIEISRGWFLVIVQTCEAYYRGRYIPEVGNSLNFNI